jgi:nucleoside-diphosphate-sugar epimerase
MPSRTVLVLGANGRFGAAAVHAFADAGWRVLAQMRREPARPLPAGAEALAIAPDAGDALVAASTGALVVVHALNPLYTRWDAEAMPLLRHGLGVAQRLGATFMLPGNVYSFGAGMPARLAEDTPQRPTNAKGRIRLAMEAELDDRAADGLRSVVIRAGDFYGGGTGSWLDLAIVKSIAQGKLVYPGPLDVPHAWAYLPDLARAFVAVASRPQTAAAPACEHFHFAGHTLTGRELLALIESAAEDLGLRPPRGWRHGGMPWPLVRAIGLVHPMSREIARMSYLWRVPHALDGRRLDAAVGPLPATPPAVALREALADLGLATPERRARPVAT